MRVLLDKDDARDENYFQTAGMSLELAFSSRLDLFIVLFKLPLICLLRWVQ